jgi:hypothetical protein
MSLSVKQFKAHYGNCTSIKINCPNTQKNINNLNLINSFYF